MQSRREAAQSSCVRPNRDFDLAFDSKELSGRLAGVG